MKKRAFVTAVTVLLFVEILALIVFALQDADDLQDTVAVNEAVQSVQNDWHAMEAHQNQTSLAYVVLDDSGSVVFRTEPGLRESVNDAILHRDTVLDIEVGGTAVGKIIIYNGGAQLMQKQKRTVLIVFAAAIFIQWAVCVGYLFYFNRTMIRPFQKLKDFARRVAGGNLDIPLEMDRDNLFGAFTESFDIMRAELRKSRIAEAEANESKKELVAKLSHDIRTPVASIKAVSEVGIALADNEKVKENYMQIIGKADQISSLVTNLFTATLEELKQLTVDPTDLESREIGVLLENADYLCRAAIPEIPSCLLIADKLRLQQVFDNIFANSYKYANTAVSVSATVENGYLSIVIEDYGGGADPEEVPLLKEKYKRGSNARDIDGAGLGLYISDYFMKEMHGALIIENGRNGFRVTVMIALSGRI